MLLPCLWGLKVGAWAFACYRFGPNGTNGDGGLEQARNGGKSPLEIHQSRLSPTHDQVKTGPAKYSPFTPIT